MPANRRPISPFTSRQAIAYGVGERELRTLVERGAVRRLLQGVYAYADIADSSLMRCRAAGLVLPPGAVLSDRTAAWIHGVDVLAFWELGRPLPVEVVVAPGTAPPRRRGVRSAERSLRPDDVELIQGLPVTTPHRTALDLGCKLQRHHALSSIDAMLRLGGMSTESLYADLERFRRRRGVVQLRELLSMADPGAESPGESWVRLVILDAGLPRPVVQFWVEQDGTPVFRLDLAYPALRICVEFDGRQFHTSDEDRARDETRRAWLRAHGWRVIVVRSEDLLPGRQQRWLFELQRAISEAERTTFRTYGRYDVPKEIDRSIS